MSRDWLLRGSGLSGRTIVRDIIIFLKPFRLLPGLACGFVERTHRSAEHLEAVPYFWAHLIYVYPDAVLIPALRSSSASLLFSGLFSY